MISVIIPTYNREKTIKRAIDSVLNQTYQNIEVIVVDDCSNDNTEQVIHEYNDQRLIYHKLEQNSGACVARNKGVELAKGEYIAFQDSDDEWLPDKLRVQKEYLEKNQADICFCSLKNFLMNGETEVIPANPVNSKEILSSLLQNNFISTQTIFGKKHCFKEEPFDSDFPRFQDWDLVIRLSQRYNIVHCPDVLVNVYKQTDSMTFNVKKTAAGLNLIIKKHGHLMNRAELSNLYFKMGKNQLLCHENALESFRVSIQHASSIKKVIYYLLTKTKLIFLYYRLKGLL